MAWVAIAALWDVRTRRIPNALIVVGLILGFLSAAMHGDWLAALSGGGLALGVGIIPFALRALGGGDVKAATVVGLFVGAQGVLKILFLTALCCGIYAMGGHALRQYSKLKADYTLPVGLPLCVATWGLILAA